MPPTNHDEYEPIDPRNEQEDDSLFDQEGEE